MLISFRVFKKTAQLEWHSRLKSSSGQAEMNQVWHTGPLLLTVKPADHLYKQIEIKTYKKSSTQTRQIGRYRTHEY